MADDHIVISSGRSLTPEEVTSRTFSTSFRGFDASEVRLFLKRVSDELATLEDNERQLRQSLEEARERAAHPELDEHALAAALGEQTTRVLQSAREAAIDIGAKAEENAARVVQEAEQQAARVREQAEAVLGQRTEEANRVAAGIREAAMEESAALRERATADATAEIEAARTHGKEMVGEAQVLRERLLGDLARRRRLAHVQIEQLRAGRERLLEAYRVVRRTLDEATEELSVAEAEARVAAEAAARRTAAEEPELTAADMELELATPPVEERDESEGAVAAHEPTDGDAPTVIELDEGPASAPPVATAARRSSGLRILGKRRGGSTREEDATLVEVHPPADDEGVRVLGDEPLRAAPTPSVDEIFSRIRADREAAMASEQQRAGAVAAAGETPPAEVEQEAGGDAVAPVRAGDSDHSALRRRDDVLEPLATQLVRNLKRALQDEQNEVLDRLRTARGKPAPDVVLLPEVDQARRYRDAAEPLLARAADEGMRSVRTGDDQVESPVVAVDLAVELASDLVGPLRDRLDRALNAAPGDPEATGAGLGAGYRQWKTERIEPVARHHLAAAFALGAYRAASDHAKLRWLVDKSEGACPDCDDNALAGPTPKGETFPTGQPYPPAHAGCRCLLVSTDE
jgi:DivIVA domain-containing protein